jgi:hypothetical protein
VTRRRRRAPGQTWASRKGEAVYDAEVSEGECREKPPPDKPRARTKTDTGRRDEDSQALERTLAKELGKLTP